MVYEELCRLWGHDPEAGGQFCLRCHERLPSDAVRQDERLANSA